VEWGRWVALATACEVLRQRELERVLDVERGWECLKSGCQQCREGSIIRGKPNTVYRCHWNNLPTTLATYSVREYLSKLFKRPREPGPEARFYVTKLEM